MGNRAPPTRFESGLSTDFPYGPLANCGMVNPFLYHFLADDFDGSLGATGIWAIVKSSTGTVATTAGDGGLALFSPAATATDYAYMQMPSAGFKVTSNYSMFFLCRFTVTATTMNNPTIWLGLAQHQASATPAITDGVYFTKANGASTLSLVTNVSSTAVTTAVPSSTLVTATSYDVGFEITDNGDLSAYLGTNLVGFQPQSGTGSAVATRGKVLRIAAPSYPTANLSPMIAILAGDTSSPTLTVDFVMVAKER